MRRFSDDIGSIAHTVKRMDLTVRRLGIATNALSEAAVTSAVALRLTRPGRWTLPKLRFSISS